MKNRIRRALRDYGVSENMIEAAISGRTEIGWKIIYTVCQNIAKRDNGDLNTLIFMAAMFTPEKIKELHV